MHIRQADFNEDYATLRAIRFAVFVDEQSVPKEIEMDDRDPVCIHLLAFDDDGAAVGTVRIDLEEHGKIGRLAVLGTHRRTGIGSALMLAAHDIAAARSLEGVWCNAQTAAIVFYERLGYTVVGERFLEAGIVHVRMEKRL